MASLVRAGPWCAWCGVAVVSTPMAGCACTRTLHIAHCTRHRHMHMYRHVPCCGARARARARVRVLVGVGVGVGVGFGRGRLKGLGVEVEHMAELPVTIPAQGWG